MLATTWETWTICETWCRNTISKTTLPMPNSDATVTLSRGTKPASPNEPTARNTRIEYTNVPTKVPIVTWVTRSPKNVRRIRGLNWLDASCNTTIVIEKVSPATVIRDPAMTDSTVRAAGPSPLKTTSTPVRSTCSSISTSTTPRMPNVRTMRPGMNPRLCERLSHRALARFTRVVAEPVAEKAHTSPHRDATQSCRFATVWTTTEAPAQAPSRFAEPRLAMIRPKAIELGASGLAARSPAAARADRPGEGALSHQRETEAATRLDQPRSV